MYICLCKGLTESDIRQVGQAGIVEKEKLVELLRLNDDECCGRCVRHIEDFVALAAGKSELPCASSAKCRSLFDSYLNPA